MGNRKFDTRKRWIRHRRVRKNIRGVSTRPRLAIFRSSNHIYAQVIDDDRGHTLAAATSLEMKRDDTKTDVARAVGEKIAKSALKNNTTLKEEALKTGLINEKEYEKIVDPKKMIYPA